MIENKENNDVQNNDEDIDNEMEDIIKQGIKDVNPSAEPADTQKQQVQDDTEEESPESSTSREQEPEPEGEVQDDETPSDNEEGFKTPKQGEHETDEAYQKRVELSQLVYERKNASNPKEKEVYNEKISETRQELKDIGSRKNINNNQDGSSYSENTENTQDINAIVQQKMDEREKGQVLQGFLKKHPEFKDESFREVFFDYVENDFRWENKTPQQFENMLGVAYQSMTGGKSTSQKIEKSIEKQEKVNSMQFPGGNTAGSDNLNDEQRESVQELMSTGMSKDKAIALVSD